MPDGVRLADAGAPNEDADFAPPPERRAARLLRVAAYDYGMKWNILRRFVAHGCDVRVYPATAPASELLASSPDGVFLSNGPGDPAVLDYAIDNARTLVKSDVPVFGICLGHQILGLAMGARTFKLKFGHRGANHPVKELRTGQIEITSQNHGFAVDPATRAVRRRGDAPQSVRRHDRRAAARIEAGLLRAVSSRGVAGPARRGLSVHALSRGDGSAALMPKRTDLKRILVIGSGPIVIGQACEFDYSGTQACKALRAEGLEVVLVNSNPATIMTDPELADRTYVEPLTVEVLEQIIAREKPDALLPTVGGQTALNLAVELGERGHARRRHNVQLIGASVDGDQSRRGPAEVQGRDAVDRHRRARQRLREDGRSGARGRGAARLSGDHPAVVHARRRRRRHRVQRRGVPRDRARAGSA